MDNLAVTTSMRLVCLPWPHDMLIASVGRLP
jgi:hypothetical protein